MAEATAYQDLAWRKAGSAAGPNALCRLGSMHGNAVAHTIGFVCFQANVDEHVESSLTSLSDGAAPYNRDTARYLAVTWRLLMQV